MPIPISDRIIILRVQLAKDRYATIISTCAPTMTHAETNIEAFYQQLEDTISKIPNADKILLMGDFSAQVGFDNETWKHVIGSLPCARETKKRG